MPFISAHALTDLVGLHHVVVGWSDAAVIRGTV
jgi:hypothetical protein